MKELLLKNWKVTAALMGVVAITDLVALTAGIQFGLGFVVAGAYFVYASWASK